MIIINGHRLNEQKVQVITGALQYLMTDHNAGVCGTRYLERIKEIDRMIAAPVSKILNMDEMIEKAATVLPEGWIIRIEVENGSGWVNAIRPDGSLVQITDDGEKDMVQLVGEAINLAHDEEAINAIVDDEVKNQKEDGK